MKKLTNELNQKKNYTHTTHTHKNHGSKNSFMTYLFPSSKKKLVGNIDDAPCQNF
jgi:hypothetical protein